MKKIILIAVVLFVLGSNVANADEINGTVKMESAFLDGDIVKISVLADTVNKPILGIAFHLLYEKDKLKFLKYDPGDFLEKGGDPFYMVANEVSGDSIIFGETLRGEDRFPVGEGKITDLYFQINSGKTFDFKFQNGVVSTLDTVRQDLDRINWVDLQTTRSSLKILEYLKGDYALVGAIFQKSVYTLLRDLAIIFAAILIMRLLISFFKKWFFVN